MNGENLQIIDVTIRQGGFMVHNNVLKEQVADIAKGLEEAGVSWMEVSHGRGIGAKRAGYPGLFPDSELLKAARKAAPKMKLSGYLSPYPYSILDVESVAKLVDAFRLSIDLDDASKSVENVRAVAKTGVPVTALLERAHRLDPEKVVEVAAKLEEAGAKAFCLADTFGSMTSDDVRKYFEELRRKTSLPLGFQGFDTTGRAIGNSLAALDAGAESLDASLLGLGPSGGMAALETLAALAPRLPKKLRLDLKQLCLTGRWYALPAMRYLPSLRSADLLLSKRKLDYYPVEFLERLAGILEMDLEMMLAQLDAVKGDRLRLKEIDLREFLAQQNLDFDVVLEFIKTGRIPDVEASS
ncbi:MAG TPA: hypothetical protein VJR29_12030 [bacterium]|nr:hypothetical protein [bacterium]